MLNFIKILAIDHKYTQNIFIVYPIESWNNTEQNLPNSQSKIKGCKGESKDAKTNALSNHFILKF